MNHYDIKQQYINDNFFIKDAKGVSGGILIVDIIDNKNIILLGKPNIKKREHEYESFGGKKEDYDITSLHTAIREFIEEFFNIKLSTNDINMLAIYIRQQNLIVKQHDFYGISYMINFNGLNQIYQKICDIQKDSNLYKYNINNNFDVNKYIDERIITEIPVDGLNEIKSIHLFNIEDIKMNKIKLRWYTKKIISKMIK